MWSPKLPVFAHSLTCAVAGFLLCSPNEAAAIEFDLMQVQDSTTGELNIRNKQLNGGAEFHDDVVLEGGLDLRRYQVGLQLDAVMALGESIEALDDAVDEVGFGELVEVSARLDYLYVVNEFQIIPHLKTSLYPALGNSLINEPWWLGVDVWYLTPFEGWEVGASVDGDLGGDNGIYGSLASRQFWQQAPLDLALWQALNLGNQDYHEWTSGAERSGITTIEVGGELTIPLPYEGAWAGLLAEVHYWPSLVDQKAMNNSTNWIIAFNTTWEF